MSIIFKTKKQLTKNKLSGSYYTPNKIAKFLTEWALDSNTKTILEPSCGDGIFLENIASRLKILDNSRCSITAIEISKPEIKKAQTNVATIDNNLDITWVNKDFFKAFKSIKKKEFDVILGNPPFIRFQNFDEESRTIAFEHLNSYGYKPTKLANVWSAFVQLSIETISHNGKLGMVIPSELLQVQYAQELRNQIINNFEHITLITFKKLVFPNIQQEVVLLLAENKKDHPSEDSKIHTIEILNEYELTLEMLKDKKQHTREKAIHTDIKWTSFFIDPYSFNLLDEISKNKKVHLLGDFCKINVGIVTGRNSFFVINKDIAKRFELNRYTTKLIGKTSYINTLSFDDKKYKEFSKKNDCLLLNLKDNNKKFNNGLNEYIRLGEEQEVHLGYKCRIRKEWYAVPSVYVSDGFMFRQIHKYPLLVINDSKALCTDTIHRVTLRDKDTDIKQLFASFINSLTFAWCELAGRSYGGGVLEIEPNEAEKIIIPYNANIELDFEYINNLINDNKIDEALEYNDNKLLKEYLGFSDKEILSLRNSWKFLRDRRLNRK